mgnify:CR=1 FL=1
MTSPSTTKTKPRVIALVAAAGKGTRLGADVPKAYVELRGRDLQEPPAEGEAHLFVAATIGGVRLIDNAGVPLGIGFKNLDQQE